MTETGFDTLVIGGGFYGARLALLLRERGDRVLLVEREATLMARASLRNQARVHNGYHYPRSILTSLRSRQNYTRFLDEYPECVDRSFPHYYAIARGMSKITSGQFVEFCRRIGAPLTKAPAAVSKLFDSGRVDAVLEVQECAFDAVKLRDTMTDRLAAAGVVVMLGTEAASMSKIGSTTCVALRQSDGTELIVQSSLILNCTYSRLNHLLESSGGTAIAAKHELTELALVEPPAELMGAAVTVMDGPFFSLMPYPSRGLFTLSHVRYTPHFSWHDVPGETSRSMDSAAHGESRSVHMLRDARRFLPMLGTARYVESLWEIKTLMPRSERDDSRPILLRRSETFPVCVTVLGAKIDSVYDVEDALRAELSQQTRVA